MTPSVTAVGSEHGATTIRPAQIHDLSALSALAERTWADAFAHGLSPEDSQAELDAGRSETYFVNALRNEPVTQRILACASVLSSDEQHFGGV